MSIQPITTSFSSTSADLANMPYPTNQRTWHWDETAALDQNTNLNTSFNGASFPPDAAPYSQPGSFGYDATAPRISLARRTAAYKRANGLLVDGRQSWQYPMFVTGTEIDIALAGTTAQSQMTRDFYPHNFTLPSFNVSGQAIDNADYSTLCEFIHQAQRKPFAIGWEGLTQLNISGGVPYHGNRTTGLSVSKSPGAGGPSSTDGTFYNQTIRGGHRPITCKGIVTAIQRTHSAFDFAPTYQFGFVVLAMMGNSIYSEPIDVSVPATTWVAILAALAAEPNVISSSGSSGSAALLKTNTQDIKVANKKQSSVLSGLASASGS
jgi:hypothetical protein